MSSVLFSSGSRSLIERSDSSTFCGSRCSELPSLRATLVSSRLRSSSRPDGATLRSRVPRRYDGPYGQIPEGQPETRRLLAWKKTEDGFDRWTGSTRWTEVSGPSRKVGWFFCWGGTGLICCVWFYLGHFKAGEVAVYRTKVFLLEGSKLTNLSP